VGLLDALRAHRHRLDLILSGSQANIEENVRPLAEEAGIMAPARAIPYGVALDGGWDISRGEAIRRLVRLEVQMNAEQRGGGLWGAPTRRSPIPSAAYQPPFIITCFSRIDVEKGTDLTLHAVSILRRQGIPARLWIAGNTMPGSSFLDVLRNKVRLMDLGHCVSLIGTVRDSTDKAALLRASDAFAAGFIRSEPFGLVYTEAFASELAVVAPDSGAAPELMRAVGDCSTLYPANDTGALAERLRRLYEEPAQRTRLAQAERRAFEQQFNATEMAKAAAREFEAAIKQRAGRSHTPALAAPEERLPQPAMIAS
jgi:glycosyltransferase involved in cell wall biosynthesis